MTWQRLSNSGFARPWSDGNPRCFHRSHWFQSFTGYCYYRRPPARAFSQLKSLATGTQAFVGKAAFQGEVVDSQTGERLIAAIGARAGGKTLKTEMSSWRDVKAAVDFWAEDVRVRLERLRASSPSS